jgi:hypothetical protein
MPGRLTATAYHPWLGATNHNAEGYLLHISPIYSGCRLIRNEKRRRGKHGSVSPAIAVPARRNPHSLSSCPEQTPEDLERCLGREWCPASPSALLSRSQSEPTHIFEVIDPAVNRHAIDSSTGASPAQPSALLMCSRPPWRDWYFTSAMMSDARRFLTCCTTFSSTSRSNVGGPSSVQRDLARVAVGARNRCSDVEAGTAGSFDTLRA